jgi:hypothetical protein
VHLPEKLAFFRNDFQLLFCERDHLLNAVWRRGVVGNGRGAAVELHQFMNLPKREAKFLQLLNPLDHLHVLRDIRTVAGRSPWRRFKEFPPLVKADGSDLHASLARQFTDAHLRSINLVPRCRLNSEHKNYDLFIAEGGHRVEPAGAEGGDVAGGAGNDGECTGGQAER